MNLSVKIGNLELKNPVMGASGTFGFGREYEDFLDVNEIGAIVTKGVTPKPRAGNPGVRIAETPSGMLNCIGLENPGVDAFIYDILPKIKKYNTAVIVNISAGSVEEYAEMAWRLDIDGVDAVEVNISCPNVKEGGVQFGTSCIGVEQITAAVRKHCTKPLMVKLSPNVTDIGDIAASAEAGGADAISMINTLTGMRIDIQTRRPIIRNNTGGVSGPALLPIAVRMIWQAYNRVKIPIVGMGGVSNWKDAVELMLAGSTALQIGTAFFTNPYAPVEIVEGLNKYLDEHRIASVTELTGKMIPWGE